MREKVSAEAIDRFMKALGRAGKTSTHIYFVGGVTAVLLGWRETTIDIDLKMVPEASEILKVLPDLKERLQVNIELASPDDFIPALPGWEERSIFIGRQGAIDFFHYDFYAQALAKIERGHNTDLLDVRRMIERGLIEPSRLLEFFLRIKDRLYEYPAIDAESFHSAVQTFLNSL
ncbi:MAG TPA: DUF6036 family nucleotidyltransferase [Pyrinomonadaceae bacterium]|jgi:hypothetical protein|nr:DUF6036 family nucleotidyltransferase [Pyrinomonadaceae bacterium]